jgi:hypothetical protein
MSIIDMSIDSIATPIHSSSKFGNVIAAAAAMTGIHKKSLGIILLLDVILING